MIMKSLVQILSRSVFKISTQPVYVQGNLFFSRKSHVGTQTVIETAKKRRFDIASLNKVRKQQVDAGMMDFFKRRRIEVIDK